MDSWQAILLGVVQGLSEFLPISSSGHLVVFQKLLGIENHSIAFDVAAHVGTVFTVVTFYFRPIQQIVVDIITYPRHRTVTPAIWLSVLVICASVPTAIIGLLFKDLFESLFSNLLAVGIFLSVTGVLLFLTSRKSAISKSLDLKSLEHVKEMKIWQAVAVGFAQAGAIAPGISRAGATIATALLIGVERKTAALFSFVLSIPAILGAALLQLRDIVYFEPQMLMALGVGFVTAYLAGLVGLFGILFFVKSGRLQVFSVYLWVVSIVVILYAL